MPKTKIAFICVHNSCRSQMAEAFGKVYLSEKYECYPAGTETKPQINQDAVRIMKEHFGNRVWFVGMQGSFARGEATENSDIDMVVILDELSPSDVATYNTMLDPLPHRELICGFLSGKNEILNWEPSDLFQFYYDTKPIKGSLDELLPLIDDTAVTRAIKFGACNIYHGCVHNMLYEKSEDVLRGLYKSASFFIQAIPFKQTGKYIKHQKDLLEFVSPTGNSHCVRRRVSSCGQRFFRL